MANKQLLSVDLTETKDNNYYDDTPFTTARLSAATRQASETSSKEVSKLIMKNMKLPLLFAGYILVGLGLIVLLGFIKALPDTEFMTALQNGKWLLIGGAVLAAVGGILLLIHKKTTQKNEEQDETTPEEDESFRKMENVAAQVQMELGTPENDDDVTAVEILPYRYKSVADGDSKEVLKSGCYENTDMYFWREEEYLCLTDYDCVMKLPLSAIEGYFTADVKFKISFWWKDGDFDKGDYAPYKIKQDSEGNYKLHTFYRVMVRNGEDRFELRVPCYDFPVLQGLVDLKCLDGTAEF